jgi:hypothetical protein
MITSSGKDIYSQLCFLHKLAVVNYGLLSLSHTFMAGYLIR